jgi:hypothetical protein
MPKFSVDEEKKLLAKPITERLLAEFRKDLELDLSMDQTSVDPRS